jgi:hypothetical protein
VDIVLAAGEVDLTWDLGIFFVKVSPTTTTTTTTTTIVATTVTTTPETLPFTGFEQGDIGGLALAMLMLGGFVLLAISRRGDEEVPVAASTETRRLVWDGDSLRWDE